MARLDSFPEKLFKYYAYEKGCKKGCKKQDLKARNKSRLLGTIFFSNPLLLNDPYDCQLSVRNNTETSVKNKQNGREWLKSKLIELELKFTENEITSLINDDNKAVFDKVRLKQQEKLGVFCMSKVSDSLVLWAYYTDNSGFCIEYNTEYLITKVVVGIINTMDEAIVNHLVVTKEYDKKPEERSRNKSERVSFAINLFRGLSREDFTEKLLTKYTLDDLINLTINFYVKRYGSGNINYVPKLPLQANSTLFFDEKVNTIENKYYTKLKDWEIEEEFRIIISLGGKKEIQLGREAIKSVRLGARMGEKEKNEIKEILRLHNMNIPLYEMKIAKDGLKKDRLEF